MVNLNQAPPLLLGRAASLWFSGRIHFPKDRIGEIIHEDEPFEIYKQSDQWDTVENAENYWMSFPMQLLKRCSVPESLFYNVHEI